MKVVLRAVLIVAFFLLTQAAAPAQDKTLEEKVVESFKAHGPTWLVVSTDHIPYQEEVRHEVLYFKWKDAEAYGEVMIFLHRAPEETVKTLKACVQVNAVLQIRKTILKRAPESFGDESYAWEGGGLDKGRFGYMFRRGQAVIVTSSSSLRAAGQLASLTLQALD